MTPPSLFLRLLVATLALGAAVGQLAYLDALTWHVLTSGLTSGVEARGPVVTAAAAHAILSVAAGTLAVLIVREGRLQARAAGWLALAVGAWGYLLAYPGIVVILRPDPGLLRLAFETHFLLVETLGLAALLRFTCLFPQPIVLAGATTGGSADWLAGALRPLRRALTRADVAWGAALILPVVLVAATRAAGTPTGDAGLHPVMDVFRVTVAAAVVLNLHDSWARADAAGRRRMGWLLAALCALLASVLLVIGGNILLSATGWTDPPFSWRPVVLDLGVLGFVGGLAATQLAPAERSPVRTARVLVLGTSLLLTVLLTATVLEVLLSSGIFGPVALPAGLGTAMGAAAIGSVSAPLLRFYGRLLEQWPGFGDADPVTG